MKEYLFPLFYIVSFKNSKMFWRSHEKNQLQISFQ